MGAGHHHFNINEKKSASLLALIATILLTGSKIFASIWTGSVGVLSEAIHSGLDLLSSVVTFFVVRVSSQPADDKRQFGYGKVESISALFEAFLLLIAGGYILYEGLEKFFDTTHTISHVDSGIWILGISVFVNLFVFLQNRKVAHEHESIAIETNAFHFLTDIFSSLAVFLSLILVKWKGWFWVDPLVALLVAVYVFVVSIQQMRKCVDELSDKVMPLDELEKLKEVMSLNKTLFFDYSDLKTRKVGPSRFAELTLFMCSNQTVQESHDICDLLEEKIKNQFKDISVNIHVEPCSLSNTDNCKECRFNKK